MFEGDYRFYFALVVIVGGASSYFTRIGLDKDKYKKSKKPSYYPEGYVFAIAWTFIYLLYVYSWTQASYYPAINSLFGFNMILNFLWCLTFFYLENWPLAMLILVSLCIILLMQINLLYKYNILATLLLIPYLLWSVFATYLNYKMIDLN